MPEREAWEGLDPQGRTPSGVVVVLAALLGTATVLPAANLGLAWWWALAIQLGAIVAWAVVLAFLFWGKP